jgi:hypothetical protein
MPIDLTSDEAVAELDNLSVAFKNSTITSCDENDLLAYLMLLASNRQENESLRHRDVIRALVINHISLQRHIADLNTRNSKIQKWVIALAVAALITSTVQILPQAGVWLQQTALLPPQSTAPKASPIQAQSPVSDPATAPNKMDSPKPAPAKP